MLERSYKQLLSTIALLLTMSLPLTAIALPADVADGFERTILAEGLANPVDFEIAPDGRIFIIDRYGKLWIRTTDGGQTLAATIPVYKESEAGLLGITLDPGFSSNNLIYLFYSPEDKSEQRVSRFQLQGNSVDLASEKVLLTIPTDRDGPAHDAGNLEFDAFGNLYIGTGDAAEHSAYAAIDEDEKNNSAEKSSSNTKDLRGKILRIKPTPDGGYTIPAGNLFDDPAKGLPEIYVMGARNPYKFKIDPATNWLFWADIGPDATQASEAGPVGLDEINLTKTAGNYGWPYFIGDNLPYLVRGETINPAAPKNTSKWNTGPVDLPPAQPHWFSKPQPYIALMGGPVYRFDPRLSSTGKLPEAFDQHYIYWDFVTSRIWAVAFDDAGNFISETQIANTAGSAFKWVIDMDIGPDGHLYLLEYTDAPVPYGEIPATGKLSRLDFTGQGAQLVNYALGKSVFVSSTETGTDQAAKENLDASNAVDGDPKTRWSSDFSEPQQISVDLGTEVTISQVEIEWDPYAWGGSYAIQTSTDNQTWQTVFSQNSGDNNTAKISFGPVKARYLRVADIRRGGDWTWGIAIYELRIFGPTNANRYANPLFIGDHYQGSGTCALCHGGLTDSKGKPVSINNDWSNSMMANAVRDPYWLAKVAAELKRNPQLEDVINDKCTRCHAPMANDALKKAGQPIKLFGTGINHPDNDFFDAAMDGVSCTVCHQISDDGLLGTAQSNSGNFTVEVYADKADRPAYGQYPQPVAAPMRDNSNFTPKHSAHISSSALCATCHDLKTPYVDADGNIASDGYESHFPEQMIFTEWKNSIYATGGREEKTCQQCHMPRVEGKMQIATNSGDVPLRDNVARHTMTGANTTMLTILRDNAKTLGVTASDLDGEIARTREFLKTAASIDISDATIVGNQLQATVTLQNHTGHKLPGGYPSRRMFIHFKVADAKGNVLFESGKPNEDGSIAGNIEDSDETKFEPHYDVISSSDQVQIYEPIMADTDGNITHTLLRAKTYLKDNRLTPEGFNKATAPADIAVHGAAVSDSNFDNGRDSIRYQVDVGGARDLVVTAELLYQPLSYGHLQDLFNDSDLPEVSSFRAMFQRSSNKTEVLASSRRNLGNAGNTGVSSGGGAMAAMFPLLLPLLMRRRNHHLRLQQRQRFC